MLGGNVTTWLKLQPYKTQRRGHKGFKQTEVTLRREPLSRRQNNCLIKCRMLNRHNRGSGRWVSQCPGRKNKTASDTQQSFPAPHAMSMHQTGEQDQGVKVVVEN